MWLFLLSSLVVGVLLSSLVVGVALARLKVWALIPVILIFSMIVVTSGFLSGLKWGTIALTVVAGSALLQLSYLVGASLFAGARLRRELIRTMQSAIGQELRDYFQMPKEVPEEIRLALAELELQNR